MPNIIIHDITIDEFAEYDHDGIGYLIGTGRVDNIDELPTVDIDAITESHEKIGYDKGFRDGYAQAKMDGERREDNG